MFLQTIIDRVLRAITGKGLPSLGGMSPFSALSYLVHRGAFAAFRGTILRLFIGRAKGLLFVGRGVKIYALRRLFVGRGVYIGDYCHLNCYSISGVHLGSHVTIREFGWLQLTSTLSNPGSTIIVGNNTYIGPRSILGAGADLVIGERCQIGANVSFVAESHLFAPGEEIFNQGVSRKGIKIGSDCWIGNNCIVLDGVKVGDGVVIGAGSVVTHDLPDYSVAVGSPARVIKTRSDKPLVDPTASPWVK